MLCPRSARSWPHTFAQLALAALASAFLTGCLAGTPPNLTVAEVQVEPPQATGQRLLILVDAESRADEQLPLKTASYTLSLNGKEVFRGERSPEASLRRYGRQKLVFPVSLPAGTVAPGPATYRVSGSVVYLPPGRFREILYEYRLLRPTTSFSGSGEIVLGGAGVSP